MNTLCLIRLNDGGGPTHGGWQVRRQFVLYVNDRLFRSFSEHSEGVGYASGKDFDRVIQREVEMMQLVLRVKCLRGKIKGFDPKAGMPAPHSSDALARGLRRLAAI